MDDIRIRAGSEVTEREAAAVLDWCREWVADVDLEEIPTPSLLRYCDQNIIGGLAFVLADVRMSSLLARGR